MGVAEEEGGNKLYNYSVNYVCVATYCGNPDERLSQCEIITFFLNTSHHISM